MAMISSLRHGVKPTNKQKLMREIQETSVKLQEADRVINLLATEWLRLNNEVDELKKSNRTLKSKTIHLDL